VQSFLTIANASHKHFSLSLIVVCTQFLVSIGLPRVGVSHFESSLAVKKAVTHIRDGREEGDRRQTGTPKASVDTQL